MKNKFMVMFVLAVFIVSLVPAAFAESDNGRGNLRQALARDNDSGRQDQMQLGQRALVNRIELAKSEMELLDKHKENIRQLVARCEENGDSTEDCKKRFEARLRNLETLPEQFQNKVAEFESRMEEKRQ